MSNSGYDPTAPTDSIPQTDRQRVLLDDLRVETARLADAVERQNELLEAELSALEVDR